MNFGNKLFGKSCSNLNPKIKTKFWLKTNGAYFINAIAFTKKEKNTIKGQGTPTHFIAVLNLKGSILAL